MKETVTSQSAKLSIAGSIPAIASDEEAMSVHLEVQVGHPGKSLVLMGIEGVDEEYDYYQIGYVIYESGHCPVIGINFVRVLNVVGQYR